MAARINSSSGGKPDKLIRDALIIAVKRVADDGGTMLAKAAEAVVLKAASGDVAAFKEVADRIDGKAVQALEHAGPDGGPIQHEGLGALEAILARLGGISERVGEPAQDGETKH